MILKKAINTLYPLWLAFAFVIRIFLSLFDRQTYNVASRTVLVRQIYVNSVQILPLFLCLAVIFGFLFNIMAFQLVKDSALADSLRRLLMGFVVTELSPLLTVLLFALRSSSAINAEMAVMKVNGEIRTLEYFRIDPVYYLFMPRILSGMFSMIFLSSLFALASVSVGLIISGPCFGTEVDIYIDTLLQSIGLGDIFLMLVKCAVFGFFITLIPIHVGLSAPRALTDLPDSILKGMVKVFLAIAIIEVLLSIPKFI